MRYIIPGIKIGLAATGFALAMTNLNFRAAELLQINFEKWSNGRNAAYKLAAHDYADLSQGSIGKTGGFLPRVVAKHYMYKFDGE